MKLRNQEGRSPACDSCWCVCVVLGGCWEGDPPLLTAVTFSLWPAALLGSSRMRECCAERFPSRLVPLRTRIGYCAETRLWRDATVTSSVLRGCVLMRGWVLMSASGRASKFLSAPMPKQTNKQKKASAILRHHVPPLGEQRGLKAADAAYSNPNHNPNPAGEPGSGWFTGW